MATSGAASIQARWAGLTVQGNRSPFGTTETGRQDFRGCSHATFSSGAELAFEDSDFSFANFEYPRIVTGSFRNCIFRRSRFVGVAFRDFKFIDCALDGAILDHCEFAIGINNFELCSFAGAKKLASTIFGIVHVKDCELPGPEFAGSRIDCGLLESVRFIKLLSDMTFGTRFNIPAFVASPFAGRLILRDVSFSGSTLSAVEMLPNCRLESVVMPVDRSSFLLYRDCHSKVVASELVVNNRGLERWLRRCGLGDSDHEAILVNRRDFEYLDLDVGLYERLRQLCT